MPKLIGTLCYLSPISLDQAETMSNWINDLKTAFLVGDEGYSTFTEDNIRTDIQAMQNHKMHVYAIHDKQTDQLIGRTLLMNIDQVNRSAMFGILMGEKTHWGKGYGTEATRLLLEFAFHGLNLHSVQLGTYAFNKRAIRCYQKVGFQEIGRRREARIVGERKYDVLLMDILASEFSSFIIDPLMREIEEENETH